MHNRTVNTKTCVDNIETDVRYGSTGAWSYKKKRVKVQQWHGKLCNVGGRKKDACWCAKMFERGKTKGLGCVRNQDPMEERNHAHSEQPHHRLSAPLTAHSDILSVVAT